MKLFGLRLRSFLMSRYYNRFAIKVCCHLFDTSPCPAQGLTEQGKLSETIIPKNMQSKRMSLKTCLLGFRSACVVSYEKTETENHRNSVVTTLLHLSGFF